MAGRRTRGDGSIRKRSDGRWEGRYTAGRNEETGKLIYKSVLARTQAECKRRLREAMRQQEQQVDMQPAPLPEAGVNKIRRAAGWRAGSEQAQDPAFHPHPDRSPAGSGSTDPGTQSASEQSLSVSFPCHRDDVQPRDRGPDPQEAPQGRRTGRLPLS